MIHVVEHVSVTILMAYAWFVRVKCCSNTNIYIFFSPVECSYAKVCVFFVLIKALLLEAHEVEVKKVKAEEKLKRQLAVNRMDVATEVQLSFPGNDLVVKYPIKKKKKKDFFFLLLHPAQDETSVCLCRRASLRNRSKV